MDPMMPPPVRRIVVEDEPTVVAPRPNGRAAPGRAWTGTAQPERVQRGRRPRSRRSRGVGASTSAARATTRPPAARVLERMRIERVSLAYGERWVVSEVTLPVRQGEVLALIGASGSGKTTLLRSLNRLTEVTAGASRAGQNHTRRAGDRRAGGDGAAQADLDGLPAAQPIPDERVRERRVRPARGAPRRARPRARSGAKSFSRP